MSGAVDLFVLFCIFVLLNLTKISVYKKYVLCWNKLVMYSYILHMNEYFGFFLGNTSIFDILNTLKRIELIIFHF